jgi:hypothetical protein
VEGFLRGGSGGIELDFVFEELHEFGVGLVKLVFKDFVFLFEFDILVAEFFVFKGLIFVVFFEDLEFG